MNNYISRFLNENNANIVKPKNGVRSSDSMNEETVSYLLTYITKKIKTDIEKAEQETTTTSSEQRDGVFVLQTEGSSNKIVIREMEGLGLYYQFGINTIDHHKKYFYRLLVPGKKEEFSDLEIARMKLFSLYLCKVCKEKGWILPSIRGRAIDADPESAKAVYEEVLANARFSDNFKEIKASCVLLCSFVFDVNPEDSVVEKNTKLRPWKDSIGGIVFSGKDDESVYQKLHACATSIVEQAERYPLFLYFLGHRNLGENQESPLLHLEDLREILRMTTTLRDGKITMEPPVLKLLSVIEDRIKKTLSGKSYTYRDFIYVAGCAAKLCSDQQNEEHVIDINPLAEAIKNNSHHSGISGMGMDDVCNEIIEDFRVSFLVEKRADRKIRFKVRPYRLLCHAIYSAWELEDSVSDENDLKEYDLCFEKKADECILNFTRKKLEQENNPENYRLKNDSACVFGVALLQSLSYRRREKFINYICETYLKKAHDSNIRGRIILYSYLLTNALIEQIDLSYTLRKEVYRELFSKTIAEMVIFDFQNRDLEVLRQNSAFYRNYTIETIRSKVCKVDPMTKRAIEEPLFCFYLGQMVEEPLPLKEEISGIDLLIQASHLHRDIFTGKPIQKELKELFGNIFHRIEKRLQAFEKFKCREINESEADIRNKMDINIVEDLIPALYAAHLLFFSLVHVAEKKKMNVLGDVLNVVCGDKIKESRLWQVMMDVDYWCRFFHPTYGKQNTQNSLYMLCSEYRLISNFVKGECGISESERVILEEYRMSQYRQWLSWEQAAENNRYADSVSNMLLKLTNFSMNPKNEDCDK